LGFIGLQPRLPFQPFQPFRLSGLHSPAERLRVARPVLPPLASPVPGPVPVLPLPRHPASLSLQDFLSRGRFSGFSRSPGTDIRGSPLILGRLFRVSQKFSICTLSNPRKQYALDVLYVVRAVDSKLATAGTDDYT
jgi:hypothetical protein